MKKGEITVFLSILFLLLISFVFGVMEASFLQVSKNMARVRTDGALYSVFGEYDKALFENYHIFAVDGSYGSDVFQEENLTHRMHYFGSEDIAHEIAGIQYLTDQQGKVFREQVVQYMESRYGITAIKDLAGMENAWEMESEKGEEMEELQKETQEEYDGLAETPEGEKREEEETDHPEGDSLEFMGQLMDKGIGSMAMPPGKMVSPRGIHLDRQVSNRSKRTGRGEFPYRRGINGPEEKLLFNEYVLKNFGDASQTVEESDEKKALLYEIEYILSGKETDRENLEAVLWKIFFIRMALNYSYLMGCQSKRSEAEALAIAVASLILMPETSEIITQMILIAWAGAESIMDLRLLLGGKKAAFVKNDETWQVSFGSLLTFFSTGNSLSGKESENGISYQDYLRMFLYLGKEEEINMRALDRIESNLKIVQEKKFFRIDQCVTKIMLDNRIELYRNVSYQFPIYFGYE